MALGCCAIGCHRLTEFIGDPPSASLITSCCFNTSSGLRGCGRLDLPRAGMTGGARCSTVALGAAKRSRRDLDMGAPSPPNGRLALIAT